MIPHSFLNAPTWNICGVHLFSCCRVWFWFSILSLGCACIAHVCTHRHRWACKLLHPGCSAPVRGWGLPNCKRIYLLHSHQSTMVFWCVLHHCVGIARNAHSSAPYRCCFGTAPSNLSRNSSTVVTPSYVGSSLASVITHRSDLIIMLQFSVVTFYNRFCQRSTSSS